MSNTIRVKTSQGIVPAEIVTEDGDRVWVKLPDSRVIERSKRKHVVPEPEKASA